MREVAQLERPEDAAKVLVVGADVGDGLAVGGGRAVFAAPRDGLNLEPVLERRELGQGVQNQRAVRRHIRAAHEFRAHGFRWFRVVDEADAEDGAAEGAVVVVRVEGRDGVDVAVVLADVEADTRARDHAHHVGLQHKRRGSFLPIGADSHRRGGRRVRELQVGPLDRERLALRPDEDVPGRGGGDSRGLHVMRLVERRPASVAEHVDGVLAYLDQVDAVVRGVFAVITALAQEEEVGARDARDALQVVALAVLRPDGIRGQLLHAGRSALPRRRLEEADPNPVVLSLRHLGIVHRDESAEVRHVSEPAEVVVRVLDGRVLFERAEGERPGRRRSRRTWKAFGRRDARERARRGRWQREHRGKQHGEMHADGPDGLANHTNRESRG
mmetsp:Transcript_31845/g.74150  ORF Transcript_31845/g.74150 Transcript_31845/m.74150 type:complete len:386 (+) Transcript_31845:364-1521(+)